MPTKIIKERKTMTKDQILEQLKFDLESRGRSQATVEEYTERVRLFQDHYGKPADQMGEAEILGYQHFLLTEKKLKPNSVNTYNSALRFVFSVTLDRAINLNKIPHVRHSRSLPILPTKEELGFLFYLAGDSLRNKALFMTIYGSGIRIGEAANLKVGDIDSDKGRIFIRKGKGGRDRIVPVSEVARDFLSLFIGHRINHLEEPVFQGAWAKGGGKAIRPEEISQRFHALLAKFGMSGLGRSTHAVRHSTATHLLDHGASIRHIQELLGHKNIDTTVRYTQVQTAGLQKVYRKYHPGEHELFETVDEAYVKRLESLLAGRREV